MSAPRHKVWDESTRPHHDAGEHSTPVTDRGKAVAQSLLDVHGELRDQLGQLQELASNVLADRIEPAAARPMLQEMAMRKNNWTLGAYCSAYCMFVAGHHSGEDHEIFPRLRRRDPKLTPVLGRLQDEHVVIHDLLEGVDRALVKLVQGRVEAATDLQDVVDTLSDALLSHLSYEENELLAPMAVHFG
ncbi:hemerythrin domain-containing protein [Streptomyces sp. NBC_01356]|uniref:hemerythrin domain-containing protein n=1 Tax=Streptomyces sp. NBC_01356 TaxID=2903836 RepID=UPI002E349787|nr:hemerythrin domain-containing protein [Streptomyces sp. NBC_01356]